MCDLSTRQRPNAALKLMFSNSQKIGIAVSGFKITRICAQWCHLTLLT